MSVYVDRDDIQLPQATVTVSEEPRSARVTYRNEDGDRFSVMVHQKPNPIGFHAKLPGDMQMKKPKPKPRPMKPGYK